MTICKKAHTNNEVEVAVEIKPPVAITKQWFLVTKPTTMAMTMTMMVTRMTMTMMTTSLDLNLYIN